jgi:hypothetical protein
MLSQLCGLKYVLIGALREGLRLPCRATTIQGDAQEQGQQTQV